MIQNLHFRERKKDIIWSGQTVMNGEIKWLTVVVDKDVPEEKVRETLEQYSKVPLDDTRKRAI